MWKQITYIVGPLCFTLTLHPLIEQIQSNVPNLCLNVWYLDDGSLCGPPNAFFSAHEIIDTVGPSRGLHLNKSKCLFSISNEANFDLGSFPAGIPITLDGFTLFGCPIGPPSFCLNYILKRTGKVQSLLARLPDLHDLQIECALLRSCPVFLKSLLPFEPVLLISSTLPLLLLTT